MLVTDRSAVRFHGNEGDQKRRARIRDLELRIADAPNAESEFLGELPARGGFVIFAGFELAAGKFPQATVSLVWWTLANEEMVASSYDCGYDANGRHARQ